MPSKPSLRLPRLAHLLACGVFILAAATLAQPAAAQVVDDGPSYHAGLRAGLADLSGSGIYDSLDSSLNPLGIQGEVRWPFFSLRLAWEQADTDGTFRPRDTPLVSTIDLDVDLDVDLYHLTAAYNAEPVGGGWSWFAGGGPSYAQADLTATGRIVSGPIDLNIRDEFDGDSLGVHAVAGVRYPIAERFELGGELMYLHLVELLDFGLGTSDESDDLDGFSGAVSFTFGF